MASTDSNIFSEGKELSRSGHIFTFFALVSTVFVYFCGVRFFKSHFPKGSLS